MEDSSRKNLYCVRIEYERFGTIEQAFAEMSRVEGSLVMLGGVSMGEGQHSDHAVIITNSYKLEPPNMQAVNSWGADQAFIKLTKTNFITAMKTEPP